MAQGERQNLPESLVHRISVPKELGFKNVVIPSDGEQVIINIQDAHASLDAQKSIAKILESMVRNYQLDTVALEGSTGVIDTRLVSAFPQKEVREQVAQAMLSDTQISGAEFFKIISGDEVELYGAEDASLYRDNIHSYQTLLEFQGAIKQELEELAAAIEKLELAVFSPELRELMRWEKRFRDGEAEFGDLWEKCQSLAPQASSSLAAYPQLKKLITISQWEKEIDFNLAEKQRDDLIRRLNGIMDDIQRKTLISRMLYFKTGRSTPGEFHKELMVLAGEKNVNVAQYPDLSRYARYVELFEQVDLRRVTQEMDLLQEKLQQAWLVTEDQRELALQRKVVEVLAKFLQGQLSSTDRAFFHEHHALFEIEPLKVELETMADRHGGLTCRH